VSIENLSITPIFALTLILDLNSQRTSGQGQSLSSSGVLITDRNGHSTSVTSPAHLRHNMSSSIRPNLGTATPILASRSEKPRQKELMPLEQPNMSWMVCLQRLCFCADSTGCQRASSSQACAVSESLRCLWHAAEPLAKAVAAVIVVHVKVLDAQQRMVLDPLHYCVGLVPQHRLHDHPATACSGVQVEAVKGLKLEMGSG
jgi:hypothetical protein